MIHGPSMLCGAWVTWTGIGMAMLLTGRPQSAAASAVISMLLIACEIAMRGWLSRREARQ